MDALQNRKQEVKRSPDIIANYRCNSASHAAVSQNLHLTGRDGKSNYDIDDWVGLTVKPAVLRSTRFGL